jgi:cell division protein ZipA
LPGTLVWDVMYSLGLQWGDMDLFHWKNESDFGEGELFSVWTSTDPGYFLPELIAAGKVMTKDLVLSFSVPRSPAPAEVFDEMIKAAKYAQSRLGGAILGDEDRPFVKDGVNRSIEDVVRRLVEAGFPPGEESTLRLF